MRTYAYPAIFEPGDTPDVVVVSFPDIPEAITEGASEAETRANAADALAAALFEYLRAGKPLPKASGASPALIAPAPEDAAKIAFIEAFLDSGLTRVELAKRLNWDEKAVRRALDPVHATKLPALSAALAALGKRMVIGVD